MESSFVPDAVNWFGTDTVKSFENWFVNTKPVRIGIGNK